MVSNEKINSTFKGLTTVQQYNSTTVQRLGNLANHANLNYITVSYLFS